MSELSTTLLFGLVSMGISEVLRRQFFVAFGTETQNTYNYAVLVLALFTSVHLAFTSHHVAARAQGG